MDSFTNPKHRILQYIQDTGFSGNRPGFASAFAWIYFLIVPPSTIIIPLHLRFRLFAGFIKLINTPLPMFILAMTGMGIRNRLYAFLFR